MWGGRGRFSTASLHFRSLPARSRPWPPALALPPAAESEPQAGALPGPAEGMLGLPGRRRLKGS